MKRFLSLLLLLPALAWAGDSDPSQWRIWSGVGPGPSGQMALVIANQQVATATMGARTTLAASYQGHDVVVSCRPYNAVQHVCAVLADGQVLKTLYVDRR